VAAGFQRHRAILLPLGGREKAILNLLWTSRERGAAEDSLLGAIARQVEIAVKSAGLFAAEKIARQRADTLRSASLAITRSLDLETIFPALLKRLGILVPFDRAKVMLLESRSRVKVRAIFTSDGALDFQDAPLGTFDSGANAAVRKVLASGLSVSIADTRDEPGWGTRGQPDVERSWLGVPLMAGGKAIGLLTLVKAEPGFFTPERVDMVEALSAPASVAIANARLFEEVISARGRIQKMARKLVEGQENERRRIARELHDEASQLLTSMLIGLRLLENRADSPDDVRSIARELKRTANTVQEGLHRLASDLRPAALDHVGLVPALGQLVAGFSREEGPAIRLETVGLEGRRFSAGVDIALYRIAQEALMNAKRHANARAVSVVLTLRDTEISMVVEDDGRGFDVVAARHSTRLGLPGIRERAEMLGGKLLVESSPDSGTRLVVEIPNAD
jgi:signal transduction histidine kinase